MAQWQERRSWPANFRCHTLDLQLMGDPLCRVNRLLEVSQPGQLSLSWVVSSELQLDARHLNRWRRHLVNAYKVKAGMVFFAG